MQAINLAERFATFEEHWSPRIVAAVNDYDVRIAKVQGEFVWHAHDDTDEFFLVIDGELRIAIEGSEDLVLRPGQLAVVPAGVRHRPSAEVETRILMLEPRGTVNTGDSDEREGTIGVPG